MIGKVPSKRKDGRSSFKELIHYICGEQNQRAVYVGTQGISSSSADSAAFEMETVAFQNVRCKDPVFHFILSWRELEFPTNGQVDEAVGIALKELDLQNCQALWALQTDTDNPHVHVAVNRIDPESGKAIQPAGNWTRKALVRAARKIEAAQGWEVLKESRCGVTAEGEIGEKETPEKKEGEKISQTARDIEAHTGSKSAERMGKEKAAPIIRAAKSWEELHEKLAERGMAFERKGSGAIVWVGAAAVKASQIDRSFSLSKLEARLGEYRSRTGIHEPMTMESEPVEKAAKEPKVKNSWERYRAARSEYLGAKKKAFAELRERQKTEWQDLQKAQKTERTKLFEKSWRGRGGELNQHRSLAAAKQQKEKLELREYQNGQRERLKKQFPFLFPNFKNWLKQEANPELQVLFRYPDGSDPVIFPLEGEWGGLNETHSRIAPRDLRAFTAVPDRWGGVGFFANVRKRPAAADFLDCGRRILLKKDCDETTVLAALQLASQKWGALKISGTEEYKKMCLELAARHGFKLANPELQKPLEEARQRAAEADAAAGKSWKGKQDNQKSERAIKESRELFERYAEAVGAEKFRIVVTDFLQEDGGGVKAFVFDKKNGGLEGKSREEILESLPKLRQYEHYGKNINVVPLSPDKYHILIDDMNDGSLEQLKRDGYKPACVIESSPGNFQAILTIPADGGEVRGTREARIREACTREAGNLLTKELNARYGDPKLSGAIHAHRLPPFRNCKPKHRQEDGTYPATHLVEADGGLCLKAAEQLREAKRRLDEEAAKWKSRPRPQYGAGWKDWSATDWSEGASDPDNAYRTHWRDAAEKIQGEPDYSKVDAMAAMRMRVTGYSAGQICEAIRSNAPLMRKEAMSEQEYDGKYRYRNWERYAKETAEKYVFGPRGAAQYAKAEGYRPYYMKLEGRNLTGRGMTKGEAAGKNAAQEQGNLSR